MGNKTSSSTGERTYDVLQHSDHDDEETKMQDRLGLICEAKKEFEEGNRYFRESNIDKAECKYTAAAAKLMQCEDSFSGYPPAFALAKQDVLNFAERRYEQAKRLLSQASALHQKYAPDLLVKDPCMCSLTIAMKKDIFVRRLPEKKQGLASVLKEHGNIDSITADLMNNLGACHEVAGDLKQAQQFYEQSLKLRTVVFGEHSLKCAESMQNLATVLDTLGDRERAGQLLTAALKIEEEAYGLDSVECSVTLNNLGVLSANLNNLPLAQSLLNRAFLIRLREYGKYNHLTICAQKNLECVNARIQIEIPHC
eukprot:gene8091-9640_t